MKGGIKLNPGSDFNLEKQISGQWNKKLKSLRFTSIVINILMIVLGILFIVFPQQSLIVLERLASILIIVLGVYLIIDYFYTAVFVRRPAILINGILNILLGTLLLFSPAMVTITTFAFMFGFLMLTFGIGELVMIKKIRFFVPSGYGWIIASGIINILVAAAFFIAPLFSSIFINYILAIYLIVGGITLLIEALSMQSMDI